MTKRPVEIDATPTDPFETHDFERQPPGTILRDFETLLNLIGDQGMPVTPAYVFAMSSLETINRSLSHPLELHLKRASQKSYPAINGLYLLVRATGLSSIDTLSKQPRIMLDPIALESWRSLNATERYFALLKAWWGRGSEEIIGERRGWQMDVVWKLIEFRKRLPKTGILTLATVRDTDPLRYYPGYYNLALMDLFGLLEVRPQPPSAGQGWLPGWVRVTDWGNTLLGSYSKFMNTALACEVGSGLPMRGFVEEVDPWDRFEQWANSVRPRIPAWRKELQLPAPVFRPDGHVFKVSLRVKCWRRIAIRGDAYLEQLAATILDAFDFDSDHLYCFRYQDRFGRSAQIDHPYLAGDSDNALTEDVKVGEIPLSKGTRIEFLFDFGDQWRFDIQTESIDFTGDLKTPRVLEKHGRAPSQYGDIDEQYED